MKLEREGQGLLLGAKMDMTGDAVWVEAEHMSVTYKHKRDGRVGFYGQTFLSCYLSARYVELSEARDEA